MIKTIMIAFGMWATMVVSIYSITIPSADGNNINFSNYRGKKILIVNTASASPQRQQLEQLQQLYAQYQDSLVVIAFPSNSFGKEPKTGNALKTFMRDSMQLGFPVAIKSDVAGAAANPVFSWLASSMQNEVADVRTTTDFQKFLIDKDGALIGVFDSSIAPLSQKIQSALQNSH